MRKVLIGSGMVVGMLMLVFLLGGRSSATSHGRKTRRSGVSKAANRRAAVRDASERLATLQLPPGALRTSGPPSGSGSALKSPPIEPSTPNLVDRHAWWVLPGQPLEVLAWIKANWPTGSKLDLESSEDKRGRATSWNIGLVWPPIKAKVDERTLEITVTSPTGGGTAMRADAQAVWVTPHPPSERIPAAARILEVERDESGRPRRSITVTKAKAAGGIAALIDRLPVVQPGTYACPAEPSDPPTVRLTFRASRNGAALAETVQTIPPDGPCGAMKLTVRGTRETALEEGDVILRRLRTMLAGTGW